MDSQEGCDVSLTRMINDKFVIDSGGKRRESGLAGFAGLGSRTVPQPLAFLSYDSDFLSDDKENAPPSKRGETPVHLHHNHQNHQDYASRDSGFESSRCCDYDMEDSGRLRDLGDLEREFDLDDGDDRLGSKYEIISTDSPVAAAAASIVASDFQFGSPIDTFGDCEASENFDRPRQAPAPARRLPVRSETTRTLDFDSDPSASAVRFQFLSPSMLPLKRFGSCGLFSLKRDTPTRAPFESPFADCDGDGGGSGCKKMRVDSGFGDAPSPLGRYELDRKPSRLFGSPCASESEECMFDADADDSSVPTSFQSLISGEIRTERTPTGSGGFAPVRPSLRRCLSLQTEESSAERVRAALFQSPNRPKKRAQTAGRAYSLSERRKSHCLPSVSERPTFGITLQRTLSDNESTMALTEAYDNANLIGDFSRPFCLPLENSQHQDLKAISGDTLAALVDGFYREAVDSYQVIDCRYPYEFEGGHIVGAKNLFTEELVQEHLLNADVCASAESPQRRVLVFHCEFSFERGPKLCRFLRRADRTLNKDAYPSLVHPEMYVLRGGYREFHERYARHCRLIAGGYTSMTDPRHAPALKRHRAESSKRSLSRCELSLNLL